MTGTTTISTPMPGETRRGLTLTQPWATLMALGAKKIETRGWSTPYRGPVLIHAARSMPLFAQKLCGTEHFWVTLANRLDLGEKASLRSLVTALPRGAAVAVARLVGCVAVSELAQPRLFAQHRFELPPPGSAELAFGDYSLDRYCWFFDDIRALVTPIPCHGALGLWEVESDVLDQIEVR